MALKSYSFKTREEALNLEKAVKELFKKEAVTMCDFRNTICKICPHKCRICSFCWSMFYKFKNDKVDYKAPLTVLKVLISAYYDSLYIPTFYFFKENICNICERYGQGCLSVSIENACPSRYLVQMESNECAKTDRSSINDESWGSEYDPDDYEFLGGYPYSGNCKSFSFVNNTKPKLSVSGDKMKILVNKLFGPMENKHA